VLQLKNYAGSCREECERRASEFPILQRAIEEADRYFEALRKVRQSSISAMEVAGYRQAARLHARRFSNAISKGSEDASVFMSFFKKARLLYGKTWSSFHDGKLGKSFFSHFGYICSQFGDFRHGSDEWTKQLVLQASDDEQKKVKSDALKRVANWLVSLLNANPAANRPLLDLHHIELFLIWRTLWQLHRTEDIFKWLHALRSNLLVRRAGTVPIPFIEGGNSLDLVFEHVATGEKPPEFSDQSSLLVLSILAWRV
jgi:hypothetical protein